MAEPDRLVYPAHQYVRVRRLPDAWQKAV